MANEGRASIEIVGDVRNFARKTRDALDAALKKIRPRPVEVPVDTDQVDSAGEKAGEKLAEGVTRGADGRLRDSRGKFIKAGESAGEALGEGVTRGADGKLRDRNGRFIKGAGQAGADAGKSAGSAFGRMFGKTLSGAGTVLRKSLSGLGSLLGKSVKGVGSGILGTFKGVFSALTGSFKFLFMSLPGLLTQASPAIAAALTGAIGTGLGVAFIGLGALALREAKPLQNAFKDLVKTLDNVGKKAAQPLLKPLVGALNDTRELIRQLRPEWTSIFKQLAPAVRPLTTAIGLFLGELTRGFQDSMPGINAALKGFGDGLVNVGKYLGDFFRTIFGNEDVIDNATEGILTLIGSALKPLGSIISGLTVVFGAWNNFLKLTSSTYLPMIKAALFGFVDGGTGAIGRIKEAWGPLGDAIQVVWDKIKAFAGEDDVGKLEQRFREVVESIKAAWGPLKDFIGVVWDEIVAFIKRKWEEDFIPWWDGTAKPWLKNAVESAFRAAWDAAVRIVGEKLSQLTSRIGGWLSALPGRVAGWIAGIPQAFANVFSNALARALAGAMNIVNGVADRIRQIPGRIRSALAGVQGAVTGAFAGAAGWLRQAGANIINGLVGALQAGFSRVRSTLGSLTAMLPNWKGPASVDRKILRESGRLVMRGFEDGILDSRRSVASTLGDVTGSLGDWARGGQNGYGAAANISGGLTFNINVSGVTGEQAGRRAAEQVLKQLAAAGVAR